MHCSLHSISLVCIDFFSTERMLCKQKYCRRHLGKLQAITNSVVLVINNFQIVSVLCSDASNSGISIKN